VATVRVLDMVADETDDPLQPATAGTRPRVTVCTGICVEKGWVVAPAFAGSDSQIRLTLPGGDQSQGRLRVIDEYSGLALIEADTKHLAPLTPAKQPIKVGAWVMSAAAWGAEKPVVSLGILSGTERTVGGMQYPPLMQLDLRTTETSSGAALINSAGELLGVVVLVDGAKDQRGWTFAVPVTHVERLLRARVEQRALAEKPQPAVAARNQTQPGDAAQDARLEELRTSVVILKRRRPVVGCELDGIGESIVVKRVEANSPAAKAGLKVGDIVQAVDGVKIRSVYQAIRPVLYKQPGDVVTYEVQQSGEVREVQVVLGGGVTLSSVPVETLGEFIRPKVDIEGTRTGRYIAKSGSSEVRELVLPGEPEAARATSAAAPERSRADELKLMEKALERYLAAIAAQQDELQLREKERRETQALILELQTKIKELQQRAP
jgi:serine protease Do